MLPKIHSFDSWSQLEEVWLGDVYPAAWYEHLAPEVRDVFQQITEITQQDLKTIQTTLESMAVQVRRPMYESIEQYIDPNTGHLAKPQITPRDYHLTLGQSLLVSCEKIYTQPWQGVIDEYNQDTQCKVIVNPNWWFIGANTVRMGRDVIVDYVNLSTDENVKIDLKPLLNHRVTFVNNGGHMDGCFAVLKPGLLLTNEYYAMYDETFPGWQRIHLNHPTYCTHGRSNDQPSYNGKFWRTTGPTNNTFNQYIIDYAMDWVGCYTETYFELNCLVVNEQNVIMLAENEILAKELESHGITVHWVPFRSRTFWDGGVHCLTLDIRRQGQLKDYFR
jgi:hypothetical protein